MIKKLAKRKPALKAPAVEPAILKTFHHSQRYVDELPFGQEVKVVAARRGESRQGHRTNLFLRTSDNKVYWTGSRPLDLLGSGGASQPQRATWCRLAGVSLPSLNTAVRKHNDQRSIQAAERRLEELRVNALAMGYRLAPVVTAKKGAKPAARRARKLTVSM